MACRNLLGPNSFTNNSILKDPNLRGSPVPVKSLQLELEKLELSLEVFWASDHKAWLESLKHFEFADAHPKPSAEVSIQ